MGGHLYLSMSAHLKTHKDQEGGQRGQSCTHIVWGNAGRGGCMCGHKASSHTLLIFLYFSFKCFDFHHYLLPSLLSLSLFLSLSPNPLPTSTALCSVSSFLFHSAALIPFHFPLLLAPAPSLIFSPFLFSSLFFSPSPPRLPFSLVTSPLSFHACVHYCLVFRE